MSLSSVNRSVLRLTGMSSGMDTTSMVTSLLQIDQMKVDKQFKAKTKLEWKGDAYRDLNLKIRNFREKYMSVLSPETNLFSSSAFKSFKVNYADESMSKYASVTAGSNANAGSYSIASIKQLASAAKAQSSAAVWNTGDTVSLDTKLKDAPFATSVNWTRQDVENAKYDEAVAKGWATATDQQLADAGITRDDLKAYLVDDKGKVQQYTVKEDYIEFSINGEQFKFNSENSLNEVITAVNANSETGVRMSYSSLSKGFTLTTRETGESSEIALADTTGNLLGAMQLDTSITHKGQDSISYINDGTGTYEVRRNSNSFAIDGMQYELKQTFNEGFVYNAADPTAAENMPADSIQFNVDRDIEPIVQKIKGFVEGYNALLEELNSLYSTRASKGYEPLTETEKSQLSEKEAEDWEAEAKKGLLYRDSNVSNLISTLRNSFYDTVQGAGRSASDIGLSTAPYDYQSGGKIQINEDALRSALMNNPEQVMDVFTKVGKNEDGTNNYSESGLVVRMNNAMNSYINTITDVTLTSNTRQLNEATSRLEDLEDWLIKREEKYWNQFTAMETAMSALNSQSSWISSMLGTASK